LHKLLASLNVPQANRLISATRNNVAIIIREVEGVDEVFVTLKGIYDGRADNVPDLERLALG